MPGTADCATKPDCPASGSEITSVPPALSVMSSFTVPLSGPLITGASLVPRMLTLTEVVVPSALATVKVSV